MIHTTLQSSREYTKPCIQNVLMVSTRWQDVGTDNTIFLNIYSIQKRAMPSMIVYVETLDSPPI